MNNFKKHITLFLLLVIPILGYSQGWNCLRRCCIANNAQVDSCLLVINGVVDSATCNIADGSINLLISSARSGGNNINWSNGATSNVINNLAAGNYTVTVTYDDNCNDVATFTVYEEICNNNCDYTITADYLGECKEGNVSIDLTVTGGTGPFTFAWSNGATTEDIDSIDLDVTYNVTVTDDNNCVTYGSFIFETSCECNPIVSVFEYVDSCEMDINLIVSGGTPPYTYSWTDNFGFITGTDKDLLNVPSGRKYIVTITDSKGCENADSLIIMPYFQLQSVQNEIQNYSCVNSNNFFYKVNNLDSTLSPHRFEWYVYDSLAENPILLDYATTNLLDSIPNQYFYFNNDLSTKEVWIGVYSINKFGCQSFSQTLIKKPLELSYSANIQDATCVIKTSITINPSGGVSPYTYLWSDSTTSKQKFDTYIGWHQFTITDANNCTLSDSVFVDGPFDLDCGNTEVIVTGGVAPFTYLWSTGNPNDTTSTIPTGRNYVTVTDATGCDISILCGNCAISVGTPCDDNDNCTINDVIIDNCACKGTTIQLQNGVCNDNNANTYNDQYVCDVACNCNCVGTPCNLALTLQNNLICPAATVTIQPNITGFFGTLTYSWTGPNSFTANTPTINVSTLNATYTLTITDSYGCTATQSTTFQYECVEESFCQLYLSSAGGGNGTDQTIVAQNDGIGAVQWNPYDLPDRLIVSVNGSVVIDNCYSILGWNQNYCVAPPSNNNLFPATDYITWKAGDNVRIQVEPNCGSNCNSGGLTKWDLVINCVEYVGQFAIGLSVACENLKWHQPIKILPTGGTPPYKMEWLTGPFAGWKWKFDPTKPLSNLATGNFVSNFPGCDCSSRTVRVTDATGLIIEKTITSADMPCCNDNNWDIWPWCP